VCTLLLVGGIRVVRQQEASTSTDAVAAELSSGSLRTRINGTLKALDTDWKNATTAGVDLLNKIAGINWRGDVGEQMKGIARTTGLKVAHYIVSAAHPLLGVVFSLMSSLFGWGGAGGSSMVEQILEEVDRMIKDAVRTLKREFVALEVRGVMGIINNAGTTVSEWARIPGLMADKFVKVFKQACWDSPGSNNCREWRTKDSGGAHLLLELKFTELMVMAGSTLLRYNRPFEVFAENIELAANRTLGHYNVFQGYRLNFNAADHGVTKATLACGGRFNNRTCGTNPGRDKLLEKDVCGRARSRCSTNFNTCKANMENWLNTCHSNYLASIRNNLQKKIKPEVDALRRAAISLRQGERAKRR